MKTYVPLRKYLAEIKTESLRSATFYVNECCLWDDMGECGRTGQATGDNKRPSICLA
jgi:hypothetical protein